MKSGICLFHFICRFPLIITKSDKKAENGYIKFILLKKVGKALIDKTVTDDEIREALQELNFNEND